MIRRFSAPCRACIFTVPAAAALALTAKRRCSSSSLAAAPLAGSRATTAAAERHPAVAAATAVERVALDELRLEMERDRDENALGNAPLPPVGWSVLHSQGSSTFQLKGRAALLTRPGGSGGGKRKRHWNADVTIDCRFESVDPSFHDAAVDLCEYVPFRVVIERRSTGDSTNGLGSSLALIADCAAVQSQLRIRRVFFAPQSAPEQAAALQLEAATGFPHSVFVGPRDFNGMSKELRTAVVEFLSACGVDDRMAEFVCQMGFYLEHEEYQLWLARLARFAESSALPSS